MPTTQISAPYPVFTDLDGTPLDDGYIYIGEESKNPETNPISVYWDEGLTQPVAQPIRTNNGYPWRMGSPAIVYSAIGNFSVTVRNKKKELVVYAPIGFGAKPNDASSVFYTAAGSGAIEETVKDVLDRSVNIMSYGADDTGTVNCTSAISKARAVSSRIRIPAGTFLVSPFDIPAGTYIETDGFATVIKRDPSVASGDATMNVVGSNVEIESFHYIGDIASGTGEWNHGIMVNAKSATGAISNVTIHDIYVENVRGDGAYFGANSGYPLSNVKVGRVSGNNILRNGVSVCGCTNLEIQSINVTNVGLFAFDIEPEPYNTPAVGVRVGFIQGKAVGVVPASASSYAASIQFGTLDLEPTIYGTNSTPSYSYGGEQTRGLVLRNTKDISVDSLKIKNFKNNAIWTINSPGELGVQDFSIGMLDVANCGASESTYNAYVWCSGMQRIRIESLVASASTPVAKAIIKAAPNLVLENVNATLGNDCVLISNATNYVLDNAVVAGGSLLISCGNGSVKNVQFNGGSLAGYCSPTIFENVTATCSDYIFDSNHEDNFLKNSTLNGSYYASGFFKRQYSSALRFGSNWLWVDSSGKLRIKSSTAPTSDTDGTIVGTQT